MNMKKCECCNIGQSIVDKYKELINRYEYDSVADAAYDMQEELKLCDKHCVKNNSRTEYSSETNEELGILGM